MFLLRCFIAIALPGAVGAVARATAARNAVHERAERSGASGELPGSGRDTPRERR